MSGRGTPGIPAGSSGKNHTTSKSRTSRMETCRNTNRYKKSLWILKTPNETLLTADWSDGVVITTASPLSVSQTRAANQEAYSLPSSWLVFSVVLF